MLARRDLKGWYLVVIGGLLPDIIDKPLGHLVMPENNGRIFAHSLLFFMVLFSIGLARPRMMPLAYGVGSHLVLDSMFMDPTTALWPLLGPFPSTDFDPSGWFEALGDPEVLSYEASGMAAMAAFAYMRWRRNSWTGGPVGVLTSKMIYK